MWFIKIYIHRSIYAGENSVTWIIGYADPDKFEPNVCLTLDSGIRNEIKKINWFGPNRSKVDILKYCY